MIEGSPERSIEAAYDDMKVHVPILRNIVKFLPGKDAVKVRLLDYFWNQVVPDTLWYEERIGITSSKVNLTDPDVLEFFMAEFPEAAAPMALHQFANFHLSHITTGDLCEQFGAIHGHHLRFATIEIRNPGRQFPPPPPINLELAKLFLNYCPTIEKLSIREVVDYYTRIPSFEIPLTQPGAFPNLVELETDWIWAPGFEEFLHEILDKAPKLRWISISIDMNKDPDYDFENQKNLAPYLRPFQHLTFVNLELRSVNDTVFKELADLDIQVIRSLTIKINNAGMDAIMPEIEHILLRAFTDWLQRQINLQSIVFSRSGGRPIIPFQLPPAMNIRTLILDRFRGSPIYPTQVPNLEKVTLKTLVGANPFAPENEFLKLTWLTLSLNSPYHSFNFGHTAWGLSFPNLETLQLAVSSETLEIMRSYMTQFPTVGKLILNFDSRCSRKMKRDNWWDFFTGGIRPIMRENTEVEDLQARIPPVPDQGTPVERTPFLLLPRLKFLELNAAPEIVAFAIINLTVIGLIPHLDVLRIEVNWNPCKNELRNFIEMLQQYHREVEILGFLDLPCFR